MTYSLHALIQVDKVNDRAAVFPIVFWYDEEGTEWAKDYPEQEPYMTSGVINHYDFIHVGNFESEEEAWAAMSCFDEIEEEYTKRMKDNGEF